MAETPTLTSLARAGGCAAKYPAARLEKLLAGFVPVEAADLLVGLDPADDAAVYRLDDERALVFTVDFFPPVVDDPRDFGAIAATNALNDVFAMGGVPLLALSITAFPEELPTEMLGEILAGADEVVRAAGAILAGGHTIRDDEPKYGLAVVGTVHPDGIWPKSGAQPGDALFLTKPLGTGLVLQAQRDGHAPAGALAAAVAAMRTLNRDAAEALRPFSPNAVTDVTGFGLLGHAYEMASRSGVRIELDAASLPALPSALELAEAGVRTGGDRRNRDYSGPHVDEHRRRRRARRWRSIPRRPAGCSSRCPRTRRPCSMATFAAAGDPARSGSVTSGTARASRYGSRDGDRSDAVDSVTEKARARRLVSARRFVQLAAAAVFTLWVVVTSGAVVRLTASGLGCDNWPRCGDKPYPERAATRRSSSATAWWRSSGSS